MAVIKRSTKGSALTYTEMDNNFDAIAPRTSESGSVQIPIGSTAERDSSPTLGALRYNSSLNLFEGYTSLGWDQLAASQATGEINQNAFSTFAVSGQTSIDADSKTDTVTLVAGTNISISTDDAADSITITNSFTQDFAFSSLTGVPTDVSAFTNDANYINLTEISVTTNSVGTAALSYDDTTGEFDYTPPDLSSYLTSVAFADLTSKPTTLAGFGITDGVNQANIDSAIANVIDSAPGALNTLNELAAALGDDPNFATTVIDRFSRIEDNVFNITADDSSSVSISRGETLTINGGTSISTTSDLEGNITVNFSNPGYIQLNSLSFIASAAASGSGNVSYNNVNGQFQYTPPDLSSYLTSINGENISQLNNDSGYITGISGLNNSDLTNDAGFITTPVANGSSITFADNGKLALGASADFEIFHDGTDSIIKDTGAGDGSGTTKIISSTTIIQNSGGSKFAQFNNSASTLYYDNNERLATSNDGVTITGSLNGHTLPTGSGGTYALLSDISGGGGGYADASVDAHLNTSTAGTGDVLGWDPTLNSGTGDYIWISKGIASVFDDITPQLGGNLDAQTYDITSLGTINTHSIPGGTPGTFALTSDIVFTASSTDTLTNKSGNISQWTNDSNYLTSVAFSDLTGTPTTLAGYGITDGGGGDVVSDTSPQLGGNLDVQTYDITTSTTNGDIDITANGTGNINLNSNVTEFFNSEGTVSGTKLLDTSSANHIFISATGNITFIFQGYSSGVESFTLYLARSTSNPGFSITWPSSVLWSGGVQPDVPNNGELDIYVFTTYNGTTWFGFQAGDAMS
jgi:hypothetical protein